MTAISLSAITSIMIKGPLAGTILMLMMPMRLSGRSGG